MTYHAGIGPGFERQGIPLAPREPHVTCDGCGAVASGETHHGLPKAWLRAGKAPPGWVMDRVEEPFSRVDYCATCKPKKLMRMP